MGLRHTKEVREALPAKGVETNGTSKITAKCNCSPCNCNPCKCPEKSVTANGSPATVCDAADKPCQKSNGKEGKSVVEEQGDIQCHGKPEVNADEETAQDSPAQVNDEPTPDAEAKPVEKSDEATTSPVIEENNVESTQAQDQAGVTEVVASEQQ